MSREVLARPVDADGPRHFRPDIVRPTADGHPRWFRFCVIAGAAGFLLRNASRSSIADLDMYHEMALIREALALGRIPFEDTFAYVPTVSPVVHHEWGTGAILYLVHEAAGLGIAGISLLRWVLVAAIALLAYVLARRQGGDLLVVGLLSGAAATLVVAGFSPVRAQMFTYLFTLLLILFVQQRARLGRWFVPAVLGLFVIWLNMHGGFVVGLGLYGLYTAEIVLRDARSFGVRRSLAANRPLLIALAAMPLLTLVNPYGWHYPPYVIDAIGMDRPLIAEWAPIWDVRVEPFKQLAFGIAVLVIAYAVVRRRSVGALHGLPMVLAAMAMSVQHQRVIPIFAVVWFCFVPGYLAGTPLETLLRRLAQRSRLAVAAAALCVALLGIYTFVRHEAWRVDVPNELDERGFHFPVHAVDFLRQQGFEGNVMTDYNAGAYMMWHLHPRVRIGMDSRYEVAYPPAWMLENVALYNAEPGWEQTLTRYPTDAVLAAAGGPLDRALARTAAVPGWEEWHRDGGFVLYRNRTAGPAR